MYTDPTGHFGISDVIGTVTGIVKGVIDGINSSSGGSSSKKSSGSSSNGKSSKDSPSVFELIGRSIANTVIHTAQIRLKRSDDFEGNFGYRYIATSSFSEYPSIDWKATNNLIAIADPQERRMSQIEGMGKTKIVVNGQEYPVYVPNFTDGSNASYDGDGWKTVDTIEKSEWSFNKWGFLAQLVGGIGSNTPTTPAEASQNEIQQNETIRMNESDKGTLDLAIANGRVSGAGLVIDAAYGVVNSINDNANKNMLKVVLQKNGNEQRAIILVGNPKSAASCKSGNYYAVPTDLVDGMGYAQAMLKNALKDGGYGQYVGFWREANIKVSISEDHKTNPYTGYISFDSNRNMNFTPIIYQNDKAQIVSAISFGGAWLDEKVEYTFDNNPGKLPVPDLQSKLINEVLKKSNITIQK